MIKHLLQWSSQFKYPFLIREIFFNHTDPDLNCRIQLDRHPGTGPCSTLIISTYQRSEVAEVTFSDSDYPPVPKFYNPVWSKISDLRSFWFQTMCASEVSMDRIGYPAGYMRFFRIRIGSGYSFLKNFRLRQDQDFCLISITKFPGEWFKMSQIMVVVFSQLWFLYAQKNQNYLVSMCCTHQISSTSRHW